MLRGLVVASGLLSKVVHSLRTRGLRATWARVMRELAREIDNLHGARAVLRHPLFSAEELEAQRAHEWESPLTISVVVPLFNTPEAYLRAMMGSVLDQTYAHWELCLADASDGAHEVVGRICRELVDVDARIRYVRLGENRGISANTNEALALATGEYVGLLDHDDLLHPAALFEVARTLESTGADVAYTDENTFRRRPADAFRPHLKPAFAPDTLCGNNYICHFLVFRRALLDEVGYLDPRFDGSQDHDLVLRLTQVASRVVHIPEILYYWRAHEGSVAQGAGQKSYAIDAGARAVQQSLAHRGLAADVRPVREGTAIYRVRYALAGTPKVSVLIPNCEHAEDLERCVGSVMARTTYPNYEVVIVENNSTSPEVFDLYERLAREHGNVRVVVWRGCFNYSAVNNYGARFCEGDYLLLLNNDTKVISPDWIQEMLMYAQREDVGAVGAKLLYPNGTIQHAGVVLGIGGIAGHPSKGADGASDGYMGRLLYAQNLSAVTGACMMVRRAVWDELGGLDEDFEVEFNDVDLCLRMRTAGYLVVWTPFAELFHHESKSRPSEETPACRRRHAREVAAFRQRWDEVLRAGDPYYHPGFDLGTEKYRIGPRMRRWDAR